MEVWVRRKCKKQVFTQSGKHQLPDMSFSQKIFLIECVFCISMLAGGLKMYNKMFSIAPFTFDAVKLCVVTLCNKPWTYVNKDCQAPKYNKKLLIS